MRGLFGVEKHPISGVYRVRHRVPSHLHEIVGKKCFTETLETKVTEVARRRAPAVLDKYRKLVDDAQSRFEDAGGRKPASAVPNSEATGGSIAAWAADAGVAMREALWSRGSRAPLGHIFPEFGTGGPTSFMATYEAALIQAYGPECKPNESCAEALRRLLQRVLAAQGLLAPPTKHPALEQAINMLLRVVKGMAEQQRKYMDGDWLIAPAFNVEASASLPSPVVSKLPTRRVSQPPDLASGRTIGILGMMERHIAKSKPKRTSELDMRLAVRRLLSVLGVSDINVRDITFDQGEAILEAFKALPKHMSDHDWKVGIPALVADFKAGKDMRPRISLPTVAKAINLLSAIQSSAISRGYADRQVFCGMLSKSDIQPVINRLRFEPEHITAIFSAPLFTGCASATRWREPGTYVVDDERRWVPLLAATMGVRLEEAGQLLVADVREDEGVVYLQVTDLGNDVIESKSLKTTSSRRRVPLHAHMLAAGFLSYVDRRRVAGDLRLFPRLKVDGKNKRTAKLSQWFNGQFLPALVGFQGGGSE